MQRLSTSFYLRLNVGEEKRSHVSMGPRLPFQMACYPDLVVRWMGKARMMGALVGFGVLVTTDDF